MVFHKKENIEQEQVLKMVIVYFHSALIWLIEHSIAHTSTLWGGGRGWGSALMNMHSSQKNLTIAMWDECIMGSKFLSGIPWPKKLTVLNLNEKDLNIFVFVCFFCSITWKSPLPCPKSSGESIPREWLIHFIVVCVTKASKTRNLNFETPYLSSLILQFPFSFSIALTTNVLGLLSSALMLT